MGIRGTMAGLLIVAAVLLVLNVLPNEQRRCERLHSASTCAYALR